MAGLPHAPNEIVLPPTVIPMQNCNDVFNIAALLPHIADSEACFRSVIDWCNFLRGECETWLANKKKNPDELGGMDGNGDAVVMEIDESKYFHRKYHTGQWRDGHWIFGGIEHHTGKCFLIEVPDHSAATLQPLICRYILPGSHIISDGWPAYANIDQTGDGINVHSVIVHQRHFVDPDDPDVHTENIENMWMRAKRKLRRQFGTFRDLFPSYIHELVMVTDGTVGNHYPFCFIKTTTDVVIYVLKIK